MMLDRPTAERSGTVVSFNLFRAVVDEPGKLPPYCICLNEE